MKLRVATSQFPVSEDLAANARAVKRHMRIAKKKGAAVIHFCEGALSGYPEHDFKSFRGYDWELLREHSEGVAQLAGELGLWAILGSSHPLSGRHKPHNSVYVIDDGGRLVDRYDKMFCAGDNKGTVADLAHYSPGEHFCVFDIKGVRCGVLICHEYRCPELYREYKQRGVELSGQYHTGRLVEDQRSRRRGSF